MTGPGGMLGRLTDLLGSGKVLVESGIVGGSRPDRAIRSLAVLVRDGATLPTALRTAAIKYPGREALVDGGLRLTYRDLDRAVDALAAGFVDSGLGEGDRIALMARNGRGFVLAALGAARAGLDVLLLNTMFAPPQVVDVTTREGATTVVLDPEFAEVAAGLPAEVEVVSTGGPFPGAGRTLDQLIDDGRDGSPPGSVGETRFVILTSGTTGTPRGAGRSSAGGLTGMIGLLGRIPHRSGETIAIVSPLFHSWGFVNFALALTLGATMMFDGRFDAARTLRLIREARPDVLIAVPVMLQRVIEEVRAEGSTGAPVPGPRITAVSGSSLPGELATDWMDLFGDCLYNLYGSTEASFVSVATPEELRADPATAGRPLRGVEVLLVDGDGSPVPEGTTGRIFARSGMAFEGYTDGSDRERLDGFVATGDVGRIGPTGLLHLDGRDDEMVISGGENLYPREIEDEIASMEGVIEVAVIGVEDDRFGQAVAAHVVVEPASGLDESAIREHVRGRLAAFKVPREVVFHDHLPRNETGKVMKRHIGR